MPPLSVRSKRKPAPARKKACEQCASSKVRCDLTRPACSRCVFRQFQCSYKAPAIETASVPTSCSSPLIQSAIQIGTPVSIDLAPEKTISLAEGQGTELPLNFEILDFVSTIDGTTVRDRWMDSLLPAENKHPKTLHYFTLHYLSCVLKTYPRFMIQPSGLPPIIHPLQFSSQQQPPLLLANCYSLVRMWEARACGSEVIVIKTVQEEMNRIFLEYQSYDQSTLLAAFQAFLIYVLMGFFSSDMESDSPFVTHVTLMQLQELAATVAASGLICASELRRSRPSWESWIIASAKRRTIYVFYLFNMVFNAKSDLPTYVAEELRGLPAPASKKLWEARERRVWTKEYDRHLASWDDKGELQISELWFSEETGTPMQRKRIEQWVQDVDEFGMMLFAVCTHIHGF